MVYTVFVGRVQEYDKWQPTLIEDTPIIKDNGGKTVQVLRGTEDPNRLIVIMEFESTEKAKELLESDFLRERFQAGGVIGKPEIYFVEETLNQQI
jgi:uncharacterized protein (DUF1330 family)